MFGSADVKAAIEALASEGLTASQVTGGALVGTLELAEAGRLSPARAAAATATAFAVFDIVTDTDREYLAASAEREACAQVAEKTYPLGARIPGDAPGRIAAAIRNRRTSPDPIAEHDREVAARVLEWAARRLGKNQTITEGEVAETLRLYAREYREGTR